MGGLTERAQARLQQAHVGHRSSYIASAVNKELKNDELT